MELEGGEGEENIIRVYCMRKYMFSIKGRGNVVSCVG